MMMVVIVVVVMLMAIAMVTAMMAEVEEVVVMMMVGWLVGEESRAGQGTTGQGRQAERERDNGWSLTRQGALGADHAWESHRSLS